MSAREHDIVLFGATGFTGQLTAAHLARTHLAAGLRLALAGRDAAKLARVRSQLAAEVPAAKALPILVADAHDRAALDRVTASAKVVATTVGPYAKYGETLVASCASNGTHYADLTGEVTFMRRTIDRFDADAKKSGARIVHTCGYDSIPSDLGTWLVVNEYRARFGTAPSRVVHAAGESRGGASGGTVASMLFLFEEASRDRSVRRLLANPYALVDGPRGGDRADPLGVGFERELGLFTGPFLMAAVNSRVVRRTSAILEREGRRGYGDVRYEEVMSTGAGVRGAVAATLLSAGVVGGMGALAIGPLRRFAAERFLPKPGEGPSEEKRRTGFFVSRFVASGPAGVVRAKMRGEGDPGYDATSRMLGESAMCLAFDAIDVPGGIRTPASTMAEPLLARLRAQRFTLELT
ncbi:MAG: saccharopine dehydrogenase NADP-binding domain-containing protein [Sandaracinus sp.]